MVIGFMEMMRVGMAGGIGYDPTRMVSESGTAAMQFANNVDDRVQKWI
jgi:hypothetical protein